MVEGDSGGGREEGVGRDGNYKETRNVLERTIKRR